MNTVSVNGASVVNDVQMFGKANKVSIISHDKMQDLDNLVSLVTEARQKVSEYSDPTDPVDKTNFYTSVFFGAGLLGISFYTGMFLNLKPVYFGGTPLGMLLMIIAIVDYKSHCYDSPINLFNILPRSLFKRGFEKRRMEYLTSQEKRMNELPKYKEAIATIQDKIALLLNEINEEMDLGDNFLSYDVAKNVLKLPNKNEYRSPALQQIFLSEEILEKKQNNHEGTHKSIE